jgi:UDP-N-acetylmuramoyl-tripeptide--D-alanyl-D-alanine ligase
VQWTAGQVAEALGVALPAQLAAVAGMSGVSIDSRTIQAGELFVAIHGASHDGHGFVANALDRGAVAGVAARTRAAEYSTEIAGKLYMVDDTLEALHQLASRACQIWRAAKPGRKIGGVAGSVGKTTTKEIFAALLGSRMRVLKTQGNLTTNTGCR